MADRCRVCLSKTVRLYNMYEHGLDLLYTTLTGTEVSPVDDLPQYMCSMCSTQLVKCQSFRDACLYSQDVIRTGRLDDDVITNYYALELKQNILYNLDVLSPKPNAPKIKEELDIKNFTKIDDSIINKFDNDKEKVKVLKQEEFENILKPVFNDDCDVTDGDDVQEVVSEADANDVVDLSDCEELDVVVLTKEEQLKEVQARKLSMNYLNSFYKCDKCFKGFITDITYQNHLVRHDESSGKHVCDICQACWPTTSTLRSHKLMTHERNYMCRLCPQIFKSKHRAKEHLKWHNGHRFNCEICHSSFSNSSSFLTHLRKQHPSNNLCDICGESFLGKNGINLHRKKAHRGIESSLRCEKCNKIFKNPTALSKHLSGLQCNDESLRPCAQCGLNFDSDITLKEHLDVHSKKLNVTCQKCQRTFINERSYAMHCQRVHLGSKLVKTYVNQEKMSAVCEICGKTCVSRSNLMYHQRIHTGEKPFNCSLCPKKFSTNQRLQLHMRTHTGETPYRCAHCPKAFKHKAGLNRHDRVHTGEKPYICTHCGKSFTQSNSLKLHVRTVHLKLPAPYKKHHSIPRCTLNSS